MFASRRAIYLVSRRCPASKGLRASAVGPAQRLSLRCPYSTESSSTAEAPPPEAAAAADKAADASQAARRPESSESRRGKQPSSEAVATPRSWPDSKLPTRPASKAMAGPPPAKPVLKRESSSRAPPPSPSATLYKPMTIASAEPAPPRKPANGPIADIDWSTSFYNIATQPVSAEQFRILMAPLPIEDIEIKPDGVIYLPEIKYRRRLNEAFGPMGWGMIPRGEAIVGDSLVTREYALIVDGRFVSQAQGENNYFGADQLPSAVEGCKSNALMRCCKDLGIASELWDPRFVRQFKKKHLQEAWVEHVTTKKRRLMWFRQGAVEVAYPYKLAKSSEP